MSFPISRHRFGAGAGGHVRPGVLAHGTLNAFYGGQVVEGNGGWRIECAVREGGVRIWVRDHADGPVATEQLSGKMTILTGGRKHDLVLTAHGTALMAEVPLTAADKVTAVATLLVAGKPVSARFAQEVVVMPTLTTRAQAGRQAFETVCAGCHGVSLRGTDQGPPLLHPFYAPGSGYGDETFLSAMAGGAKSHHWKFGDMPKPEGLAAGTDKAILDYIRALQAANGLAATEANTQGRRPRRDGS